MSFIIFGICLKQNIDNFRLIIDCPYRVQYKSTLLFIPKWQRVFVWLIKEWQYILRNLDVKTELCKTPRLLKSGRWLTLISHCKIQNDRTFVKCEGSFLKINLSFQDLIWLVAILVLDKNIVISNDLLCLTRNYIQLSRCKDDCE